jgi:hypothetical protein
MDLLDSDVIPVSRKFQSNSGLASADPLSQSTVCNGFLCDMNFATLDKLTEETLLSSALEVMYYPLYSGWKFPELPFLFLCPTEVHVGQYPDSRVTV